MEFERTEDQSLLVDSSIRMVETDIRPILDGNIADVRSARWKLEDHVHRAAIGRMGLITETWYYETCARKFWNPLIMTDSMGFGELGFGAVSMPRRRIGQEVL
jgi:hypothetical protein